MRSTYLIVGGVVLFGLFAIMQTGKGQSVDLTGGQSGSSSAVDSIFKSINSTFEDLSMYVFKPSRMATVQPKMLNIPNVRAFFAVIRHGEGTSDANGFRRIFGGQLLSSYKDHPRITVRKNGYVSTAAGAFQFLSSTWDETRKAMGLADFSPTNQELGALGRIAARGALGDVINGNFEVAIKKCAKEWASLPYSPYGQPKQSMQTAQLVYLNNNGKIVYS